MNTIPILLLTLLISNNLFSQENKSNLVWENDIHQIHKEDLWKEAQGYCKQLKLLDKKWRLPTFEELKNYNKTRQRKIVKDDYYWSSNENTKDQEEILIYDLSNQLSCEGVKDSDKYYVLCVTEKNN